MLVKTTFCQWVFALRSLRFPCAICSYSQVSRSPTATGTSWGCREGCGPHCSFPLMGGGEEVKHLSFGELKRTIRCKTTQMVLTCTSLAHLGGILL